MKSGGRFSKLSLIFSFSDGRAMHRSWFLRQFLEAIAGPSLARRHRSSAIQFLAMGFHGNPVSDLLNIDIVVSSIILWHFQVDTAGSNTYIMSEKKKAYSEDEIHVIVDMVEADYDAISSRFTNQVTNKSKAQIWDRITQAVNADVAVYHYHLYTCDSI